MCFRRPGAGRWPSTRHRSARPPPLRGMYAATAIPNQAPGAGPRGSGAVAGRRTSRASAGTATSRSTRRPDAEPRIPMESNAGPRSTPSTARSTSQDPTSTGSVPSIRAVTNAWVRFGSQVVQVFSPVSRHVPSAASTATVPGIAPRAGDPPPSSVAALLTRAPSATIAANSRSRRAAGTASASTSAPTTWTCMANPSAVAPSIAPSALSTSTPSTIRPPIPPAAEGTISR